MGSEAKKHEGLLPESSLKNVDSVRDAITQGWCTDPEGIAMHEIVREEDKDSLTVYRSFRGTSQVEGVHSELKHIKSNNMSPALLDIVLSIFRYQHNTSVSLCLQSL